MKRLILLISLLLAGNAFAQTLGPQRFVWQPPTTGELAVSYVVETREDGGDWALAGTTTDAFYVFTEFTVLHTYEVRVAAVDASDRQGSFSLPSLPLTSDQGPPGAPGIPVLQNP